MMFSPPRRRAISPAMLLLALLALLLPAPAPAGNAHFLTVTHQSEILRTEKTFSVFVPREADPPGQRFPVLYMLHGAYSGHTAWPSMSTMKALAGHYRMILVCPDGGPFGWYVDSVEEDGAHVETYIIEELIPEIDRLFPTRADRASRGIMGLSMGGHGAITLAAKHPQTFASASSLSGILNITNHPDQWELSRRLGPLEESRSRWEANSAWHLAGRFAGEHSVRLLLDCGDEDATGALEDSRVMHERLAELGVPHIWRIHGDGHTSSYWSRHLQDHLNFHQATFITEQPEEPAPFQEYFRHLRRHADESMALPLNPPERPVLVMAGSANTAMMSAAEFPGFTFFNRGIGGDRIGPGEWGIARRLELAVFDLKPDHLILKAGNNDLIAGAAGTGQVDIHGLLDEFGNVMASIRERLPETRLWITTSFPVRGRHAAIAGGIARYNAGLLELAAEYGAGVIDMHEALAEEGGNLLREEYSLDGLHLNERGIALWAEKIRAALQRGGVE